MVSRQFLIQQSVISALEEWLPGTLRMDGTAMAARQILAICDIDREDHWFLRDVRKHFAILDRREREIEDYNRLDGWLGNVVGIGFLGAHLK